MEPEKITRINTLARKQRTEGLTPQEQAEQHSLRMEYLHDFRENTRSVLESVRVEQEDGSYQPLPKKGSPAP